MKEFLDFMKLDLENIESISLESLRKDDTAIIVVDMIKGFYNIGPLANEKVADIIPNIVKLDEITQDYKKIFFIDSHSEDALEFNSYPSHCVSGTIEAELIDELASNRSVENKNTIVVRKNSVNGFHCTEIRELIDEPSIRNYIVVGVCTDICVKNFAMSTVTYFNQNNLDKTIIVPTNMIETFDAPFHNRDFWNLTSLFEMKSNGVKIVKNIL